MKMDDRIPAIAITSTGKRYVDFFISVAPFTQFIQWQIRHYTGSTIALLIDDHLVDVTQNLFHGFQIETLAGHFWCFGVFLENSGKARRLTLCFIHNLCTVPFGFFQNLCSFTTGFRQNAVCIGVRHVLQTVTLLGSGLNVPEGVNHAGRRIGTVKVHTHDIYTTVVAVECVLNERLQTVGNHTTVSVQDWSELGLCNDLTHGRFRHGANGLGWISQVEQVFGRVRDVPNHLIVDIHNIFVAGQHQAIFAAAGTAHVFGLFPGYWKHFAGDQWPGCKV
mmetsp:Transcript_27231/g.49834  ORF Transcript_27231/g.49834 Transcript_27231/m.49834 type:complete len:278 (-) Transcript_27231:2640-3473(-)